MAESICSCCGAKYLNGMTCEEVFHQMLSLEFSDPNFGEVHFLTVACYMVQDGQYSPPALLWVEQKIGEYLKDGLAASQKLRLSARQVDGKQRNWQVLRQPDEPQQDFIPWSTTIQQVFQSYQDPSGYCRAVRHWAEVTLKEMQPLLKKDDGK